MTFCSLDVMPPTAKGKALVRVQKNASNNSDFINQIEAGYMYSSGLHQAGIGVG